MYIFSTASAYITSSSGDVTSNAGSDVTLTITASGDPDDITYVWKKNGVIIPGETSDTLTLNDVSGDDIGQYECIPSNSVGSHNSSIIQVDVNCEFQKQISFEGSNYLDSFLYRFWFPCGYFGRYLSYCSSSCT